MDKILSLSNARRSENVIKMLNILNRPDFLFTAPRFWGIWQRRRATRYRAASAKIILRIGASGATWRQPRRGEVDERTREDKRQAEYSASALPFIAFHGKYIAVQMTLGNVSIFADSTRGRCQLAQARQHTQQPSSSPFFVLRLPRISSWWRCTNGIHSLHRMGNGQLPGSSQAAAAGIRQSSQSSEQGSKACTAF